MKTRCVRRNELAWLGWTSAILLLWSAGISGRCPADPAAAAARTTHWHSVPLPPDIDPNIPRVVHPISGTDADRPALWFASGITRSGSRGVLWITLECKPYYWDGDRFRKPLGARP